MTIHDRPHYLVRSPQLATWLRQANPDSWWSVDGDPLLTALLDFPCPTEELALQLDQLDRDLVVESLPDDDEAVGQPITTDDLAGLVRTIPSTQAPDAPPSQTLYLCWRGDVDEWVLAEEVELAAAVAAAGRAQPTA